MKFFEESKLWESLWDNAAEVKTDTQNLILEAVGMRNYKPDRWYVKVIWTGRFNPKPGLDEVRKDIETFVFDHLPTETEIVDALRNHQYGVVSNPDWKELKITGYTIMNPVTPKVINL
jgi:hypothetical protein